MPTRGKSSKLHELCNLEDELSLEVARETCREIGLRRGICRPGR